MSGTLSFIDRLLILSRHLHQRQRPWAALRYLTRLAALPDLPAAVAEEAQLRLAEIYLGQRKYRRARRHLTSALLYRPDSARYHYLMATALARGRYADLDRAAVHYRKALDIEGDEPLYLADFGRLCLRQGDTEEGLGALMRAVQLAPNDPDIVGRLVKGLGAADRWDEAEEVVRAARFRNPRDLRFEQLWNRLRFRRLRKRQQAQNRTTRSFLKADDPVLLPFVRWRPAEPAPTVAQVRQDAAEPLPAPHGRRPIRRSNRKHG